MKINGKPDGGGGGGGVITSLSISANGTYTATGGVDGYSPVEVSVPIPVLGSGKGKYNGMFYPSEFNVEAFDQFEVNVPDGDGTWSNPFNVEWVVNNQIIGTTETSSMYVRGYVTSVISGFSQTGTYGNANFLVGSTPDGEALLSAYRLNYFDNKKYNSYPDYASKPDVQVGDEVIMYGNFRKYNNQPQTVANKNYIYTINGVYGVGMVPGTEYYIKQNGDYHSLNYYDIIVVDVPAPAPVTESLSVSVNGTYYPGQGVDGFSQVVVDVPQSGTGYTEAEMTEGAVVSINNDATYVGSYAFYMNGTIQTVYLPSCSYVGREAFGYASVVSVNLPVCEKISYGGFYECSSLTQISLPVCEYVDIFAFQYCYSLSEVILPSCSHIGASAFQDCNSLSNVVLPMVAEIEQNAFRSCSMLRQITLGGSSVCSISNITLFIGTPISSSGTGSIYVPASLLSDYQTAIYWSYYSSHIFPIPE